MNEYCSYLWQTYNTLCYLDCKMYFNNFILKKYEIHKIHKIHKLYNML